MKRGVTTPLDAVRLSTLCLILGVLVGSGAALADDPAIYRPAKQYPILEEIKAARATAAAVRDSLRDAVETRYAEEAEGRRRPLEATVTLEEVDDE